jgi:hypothetical protein
MTVLLRRLSPAGGGHRHHVSAQRGLGDDIESIDADGKLFFIEEKGPVDCGLPGFWDTQITRNLQQLLAAGRTSH